MTDRVGVGVEEESLMVWQTCVWYVPSGHGIRCEGHDRGHESVSSQLYLAVPRALSY